jgi:hypothetical protein
MTSTTPDGGRATWLPRLLMTYERSSPLYQVRLVGENDELRAIPGTELDHRPADVRASCGRADDQPGGDLVVAEAVADQSDDLSFPLGQAVETRMRLGGGTETSGAELGHHTTCDRRREQRVALGDEADGPQQLGRLRVLEQKSARAVRRAF